MIIYYFENAEIKIKQTNKYTGTEISRSRARAILIASTHMFPSFTRWMDNII